MIINIIGDIHGLHYWREVVKEPADRYIFLGDYVDSFDISPLEQLLNLQAIVDFAKDNPKVVLLVGNHDYHYMSFSRETYSGFQHRMKWQFQEIFNTYRFKIAHIEDDIIFSHAGISKTFLRNLGVDFLKDKQLVDYLNDMWESRPVVFQYCPFDHTGVGDHPSQSPLWIRPNALQRDKIDNFQVVGHTSVGKIEHWAKAKRRGFYLADAFYNGFYLRYDGKFEVRRVKTIKE